MGNGTDKPDRVKWMPHARDNWFDRARRAAYIDSFSAVWDAAIPVHYPPARDDAEGYYHPDGDVVIIAKPDDHDPDRTVVVSVIALTDRPEGQQEYVREQAASERPTAVADGGDEQ